MKHQRISFRCNASLLKILLVLAKHEDKSLPGIAKELIKEALELREELSLFKFIEESEKLSEGKQLISHEEAWK